MNDQEHQLKRLQMSNISIEKTVQSLMAENKMLHEHFESERTGWAKENCQLRSELEAEQRLCRQFREYWEAERDRNRKSINRACLTEFVKAYESLKSGTDCAITDSDVSNAFARAIEAVNQELRRTE